MRNVSQILQGKGRKVHSVSPQTPVIDMIRLLAEQHIGAVVVMKGDELLGIVSERDYARKVILMGRSSKDTPVEVIMSHPVVCVSPTDSVTHCMTLMTERHVRHLPVVEDGHVVAMVSVGDLVKAVIEDQQQEINQLQQYISG